MESESKRTEVLFPFGGWRFEVEERTYCGSTEFWAWRIGIFENQRKAPLLIAACGTFEEAESAAAKVHERIGAGI